MISKLKVEDKVKAVTAWPRSQVWIYSVLGILVFTITSSRRIAYYDFNYIQNAVYRMTLGEIPFRDFDLVLPAIPYLFVFLIHFLMNIPINVSVYFATCVLIIVCTHSLVGINKKLHKNDPASVGRNRLRLLLIFSSLFGVVSVYPNYVYDSVASAFALAALNQYLGYLNEGRNQHLIKSGISLSLSTFSKYNMGGFITLGLLLTLIIVALKDSGNNKRRFLKEGLFLISPSIFTLILFLYAGPMSIYNQTIVAASKFKNLNEVSQLAQYYYPPLIMVLLLILVTNYKNKGTKTLTFGSIIFTILGLSSVLIRQILQNENLDRIFLHIFPNANFIFPILMLLALHKLISERDHLASVEYCVLISLPLFFFGSFLSQGWNGSSYSLWPMLAVLASITVYSPDVNRSVIWNCVQISGIGVLVLSLGFSIIQGTRLNFVEDNGMRNKHHFNFEVVGTAISSEDLKQIAEVRRKIRQSGFNGSTIVLPAEDSIESFGSGLLPWGRCLQYTMICPSFDEQSFLKDFQNNPPKIVIIKHNPQIVFEIEPRTLMVQKEVARCYSNEYRNETYILFLNKRETPVCLKEIAFR